MAATTDTKKSLAATAVEQQHETILAALRRRPHTTQDLRERGVFQVSARIKELREMGHKISTSRVTIVDRWGFAHPRAALYSLAGD